MHIKRPILVAGGAGFIGSHMVLALQQAGFEPIILDNLSKGCQNIVPGVKLVEGEVADQALLSQLFKSYSFPVVIHFASLIDVAESVQYPEKYYQNNVAATRTLLNTMLQYHVRRFIFSSSAAVYGEPQYLPIDENHPLLPINPYGACKQMVEEMLKAYAKSNPLSYINLRYFNAAGADPEGRLGEHHQPESHLIPLVLQTALGLRKEIIVYGKDYATPDGTCVRDYVHVSDLCEAHLLALRKLFNSRKPINATYNLGIGKGYSIKQVIKTVECVTKKLLITNMRIVGS